LLRNTEDKLRLNISKAIGIATPMMQNLRL
jgi:hypothetical protein